MTGAEYEIKKLHEAIAADSIAEIGPDGARDLLSELDRLRVALAERDTLVAQMREMYDHVRPYVPPDMVAGVDAFFDPAEIRRAVDQWRAMREVVLAVARHLPSRDHGTIPIPAALVLKARRALGRIDGGGKND